MGLGLFIRVQQNCFLLSNNVSSGQMVLEFGNIVPSQQFTNESLITTLPYTTPVRQFRPVTGQKLLKVGFSIIPGTLATPQGLLSPGGDYSPWIYPLLILDVALRVSHEGLINLVCYIRI